MTTREHTSAHAMRVFFALFALAVGMASVSGLALIWDGSYTLFDILETELPVASYGRLTDVALRAPVVALSRFTANPLILQTVFTLPYALLPLVALAAAWWVVRDHARALFVWAALGIGLVTLPGQVCFVCQGVSSIQLFWPILLAVLIGMPRTKIPLVVALGIAIFFFHPSAIPLFAFAALAAFWMGLRDSERRRTLWIASIGFGLASAAAELKLIGGNNSYELEKLSLATIQTTFQTALAGLPNAALVFAGVAALLIFFQPFIVNPAQLISSRRVGVFIPSVLALSSIALAGGLLYLWASSPSWWAQAIDFRSLALITSIPFMLLALLEALLRDRAHWHGATPSAIWNQRLRITQLVAAIFLIVIATQSIVWQNLSQRLRATMDSTPAACVSASSLDWLNNTPLDHWAITSYSLLMQGRVPDRVVMFGDGCTTSSFREGLPVAIFSPASVDLRGWQGGWFDLSVLGAQLSAQYEAPPKCDYPLTEGWDVIEENGADWWRWTNGDARVRVLVAQDAVVTMSGEVVSFQNPNQIDVWGNGQILTTVDIVQTGFQSLPPQTVTLVRGENTIEFKSHNPAVLNPGDNRPLAMAVKNLTLTTGDGVQLCQ